MIFNYSFQTIIILLPILLFSLVFHEYAHAYVAYKLGDKTAKNLGRLTLNPLAHIDPIGGLMVLFVGFGWAKPVPVNAYNLKDPRKDMMKIAAAGPIANIILAILGGILFQSSDTQILQVAFYVFTQINVALALFNMIPVSPLDGSQILSGLLVKDHPKFVYNLQKHGPKVLLGAILIGVFTNISPIFMLIGPPVKYLTSIFTGQI